MLLHLYLSQEIVAMESVLTARDLGCCKHPPDLRISLQLGRLILVPKLTSQLRDKQSLQYYSYGHDYASDEAHKGFCRHNCRRGSLIKEKNHWGASDCPVNICKHTWGFPPSPAMSFPAISRRVLSGHRFCKDFKYDINSGILFIDRGTVGNKT